MTSYSPANYLGTVFALLLVADLAVLAEISTNVAPAVIDIFTVSGQPANGIDTIADMYPAIALQIHKLDTIKRLNGELSQGLSANRVKAKRQVLQRMQKLSKGTRDQLEQSAMSLAKAVQLGVGQYPAIVFDGEFVVYGLTDLSIALTHYRHWQQGQRT